jgi:hypothetical protein
MQLGSIHYVKLKWYDIKLNNPYIMSKVSNFVVLIKLKFCISSVGE